MIGDRVATYVVRGLLKDEGPARVLDGNFVLMDIAAAQLAFDRLGRIDRIDVLPAQRRRPRSHARGHRRAAARRPPGAAAVAPRRAGGDDAGGVSPEPDRAVVDRADRRAVPRLQHRHDLGDRAARGDRHAARARRDEPAGARCCSSARPPCWPWPASRSASGSARVLADAAVALTSATVSTLYIAVGGRAAGDALGPRGARGGHRHAAVAAGGRGAGARSQPRAADGRDARRTTRSRCARACGPCPARRAARDARRLGVARAARPGQRHAALRVSLGLHHRVRRVAPRAGDHVRPEPRASRTLLRGRLGVEGLLAHANLSAAIPRVVDLGGGALGEPLDDGGHRGDDRQLPRHGGLLGGPDAAGGPLHRAGRAAHRGLGADALARGRRRRRAAPGRGRGRHVPQRGPDLPRQPGGARRRATSSVVLAHGSLLFKSPSNAREALARGHRPGRGGRVGGVREQVPRTRGDTITLATPQGRTTTSASRPSTTTTPATAAW